MEDGQMDEQNVMDWMSTIEGKGKLKKKGIQLTENERALAIAKKQLRDFIIHIG